MPLNKEAEAVYLSSLSILVPSTISFLPLNVGNVYSFSLDMSLSAYLSLFFSLYINTHIYIYIYIYTEKEK